MTWKWQKSGSANDAVNTAPATGAEYFWFFRLFAVNSLGASVVSDSDGTTRSGSGTQITGAGTGANGLQNTNAWYRLYFATSGRELIVQRGSSNALWRIKWSHADRFTTAGTGSQTDSNATDQQYICGGGTEASPTFSTILGTDASYKAHFGGDDADQTWASYILPNGGGTARRFIHFPLASGSYPSADVAPYVVDFNTSCAQGNMTLVGSANSNGIGQGWYKKGLSGAAWVIFGAVWPNCNSSVIVSGGTQLPVNPYTGNDDFFFAGAARPTGQTNAGWKGWIPQSHFIIPATTRADGDVIDVDSDGDTVIDRRYAIFDDCGMRWPIGIAVSV